MKGNLLVVGEKAGRLCLYWSVFNINADGLIFFGGNGYGDIGFGMGNRDVGIKVFKARAQRDEVKSSSFLFLFKRVRALLESELTIVLISFSLKFSIFLYNTVIIFNSPL